MGGGPAPWEESPRTYPGCTWACAEKSKEKYAEAHGLNFQGSNLMLHHNCFSAALSAAGGRRMIEVRPFFEGTVKAVSGG